MPDHRKSTRQKKLRRSKKVINLEVTDSAKDELSGVLKENAEKSIRIFIQGAGWGGPKLGLALDEPTEMDEKVEINGIDFVYKTDEGIYLNNSVIDFQETFSGKGFTIQTSNSNNC